MDYQYDTLCLIAGYKIILFCFKGRKRQNPDNNLSNIRVDATAEEQIHCGSGLRITVLARARRPGLVDKLKRTWGWRTQKGGGIFTFV